MDRDPLPRPLARQVLVEAGHRCAIPTCRQVPVEIAHIIPWSEVKTHTFENLIALCPTCHTRYDREHIDRISMRQYKANLGILNSRYGDLERRVLEHFAQHPEKSSVVLFGGLDILLSYLVRDGLLEDTGDRDGVGFGGSSDDDEIWSHVTFRLTSAGRSFVEQWMAAKDLASGA